MAGRTHDDDGWDDVASRFASEKDTERATCPPENTERDMLLRACPFHLSAIHSRISKSEVSRYPPRSRSTQKTDHVFVTPSGRVRREKVVLGEGVDDPPEHDDPRVEVFLTDSFPSEEPRADAEHEEEDHGVADKGRACFPRECAKVSFLFLQDHREGRRVCGRTHDEVSEALAKVVAKAETERGDSAAGLRRALVFLRCATGQR